MLNTPNISNEDCPIHRAYKIKPDIHIHLEKTKCVISISQSDSVQVLTSIGPVLEAKAAGGVYLGNTFQICLSLVTSSDMVNPTTFVRASQYLNKSVRSLQFRWFTLQRTYILYLFVSHKLHMKQDFMLENSSKGYGISGTNPNCFQPHTVKGEQMLHYIMNLAGQSTNVIFMFSNRSPPYPCYLFTSWHYASRSLAMSETPCQGFNVSID